MSSRKVQFSCLNWPSKLFCSASVYAFLECKESFVNKLIFINFKIRSLMLEMKDHRRLVDLLIVEFTIKIGFKATMELKVPFHDIFVVISNEGLTTNLIR